MIFRFMEDHRSEFGVGLMCQAFEVSRSGYYAWRKRPESRRARRRRMLLKCVRDTFRNGRGAYGSPRVFRALQLQGIPCGKNMVAELMRDNGLRARTKRRFKATTDSKHNLPVAENILARNFAADAPNKSWVADITYVHTDEGWLYLAAVLDLHSRMIVGWAMDKTMTRELVADALVQAVGRRRPPAGLLHHSDRGSQYASHDYQHLLRDHNMVCSMSRKGECYDNACIESFFHSLKVELIYQTHYRTRSQARKSIFEYIEVFYSRQRLHSSLGYLMPTAFEQRTPDTRAPLAA